MLGQCRFAGAIAADISKAISSVLSSMKQETQVQSLSEPHSPRPSDLCILMEGLVRDDHMGYLSMVELREPT